MSFRPSERSERVEESIRLGPRPRSGQARGEAFGFAIREELTRPGRVHAGRVHHKGPGGNVGSSRHYLGRCLGGRMGSATRDLQ